MIQCIAISFLGIVTNYQMTLPCFVLMFPDSSQQQINGKVLTQRRVLDSLTRAQQEIRGYQYDKESNCQKRRVFAGTFIMFVVLINLLCSCIFRVLCDQCTHIQNVITEIQVLLRVCDIWQLSASCRFNYLNSIVYTRL